MIELKRVTCIEEGLTFRAHRLAFGAPAPACARNYAHMTWANTADPLALVPASNLVVDSVARYNCHTARVTRA